MVSASSFLHRRAGHCGSGSLRNLLEFEGLDYGQGALGEEMVFGLAGGLGFFYAPDPSWAPPFYLVGRTDDLERDIADILDAELDVRESDDAGQGWDWASEQLAAGRPAMVRADIAELEYLRVKMSNTRHAILVVGHDPDTDTVWIADNDRDDLVACSRRSLAAARTSRGFPSPNRNATYVYRWPEQLPDIRLAVTRALSRAVSNMTGEVVSVGGLPGASGLAGVDAFVSSFERWPDEFPDALLPAAMSGLWVFIVKAGTGGAMFRSLHAGFLREAGELLDDPDLRTLADHYDRLSAAWIELADCAKCGAHEAGVTVARQVHDLEHAGVALMASIT
ncbi:BtrH N-terminal domain-containing protein [Paraconexibacter antarcticus]|uniref:BtrH N-terminal domain-containing protein n=1 Tax=Paraconexibacter antarcticus TaxID=2949664 RepID=A0ABY5DS92_9ACTN|nr:BtrH N-terminal domain-containing protein [Paraconexibacter antarcticus]UTI63952.1 BtrH N-terminal domain-containing protein [Paraconexibacter antarcticus]